MKDFKKYYIISAPPEEVYMALTNPATIQLWTGEKAEMSTTPGSEFSLWEDSIVGKNLEFIEGKKILFSSGTLATRNRTPLLPYSSIPISKEHRSNSGIPIYQMKIMMILSMAGIRIISARCLNSMISFLSCVPLFNPLAKEIG